MLDAITWYRQSALRWTDGDLTVYIDPWGTPPDATPADLILITHAHFDHFQPEEIARLRGEGAAVVAPVDVATELTGAVIPVAPGRTYEVAGVRFTTVPAYNVVEGRLGHPKAKGWVGYVLELGGASYYAAGDTDHVPELDTIRTDVAFVPIGGTFTMDVGEAAGLVRAMNPRLAVPYHYGFVVGSAADGELFRREAAPVAVELIDPDNPFERP